MAYKKTVLTERKYYFVDSSFVRMTNVQEMFNLIEIKKAVKFDCFSVMISTTPIWIGNSDQDNK